MGVMDPEKLEKDVLDFLLGFSRVTDSCAGFPGISQHFRTPEARCKLLVKVIKAVKTALEKMQISKLPEKQQSQAKRLVQYLFCIVQETFNSFGKKELDGKGIKQLQECLIVLGFPQIASRIFKTWAEYQRANIAPPAEPEKDKKDDKKDKKDDKKD